MATGEKTTTITLKANVRAHQLLTISTRIALTAMAAIYVPVDLKTRPLVKSSIRDYLTLVSVERPERNRTVCEKESMIIAINRSWQISVHVKSQLYRNELSNLHIQDHKNNTNALGSGGGETKQTT